MVCPTPLQQHITPRHWIRPRCGRRPLPQIQSLLVAMHVAAMGEDKRSLKDWSAYYGVKKATVRTLLARYKHLRGAVEYEESTINRVAGERIQQALGKKTIEFAGLAGCELQLKADRDRSVIIISRA